MIKPMNIEWWHDAHFLFVVTHFVDQRVAIYLHVHISSHAIKNQVCH